MGKGKSQPAPAAAAAAPAPASTTEPITNDTGPKGSTVQSRRRGQADGGGSVAETATPGVSLLDEANSQRKQNSPQGGLLQ